MRHSAMGSLTQTLVIMKSNVVAIGENGFFQLSEELSRKVRGSALGFHKSWWKEVQFFTRDGYKYVVENVNPEHQLGLLSKLLSQTIYNPTLIFEYSYSNVGKYEVSELQAAIRKSVENDEDIFTQYFEKEELLQLLITSNDFDSIVAILVRCCEGDVNG